MKKNFIIILLFTMLSACDTKNEPQGGSNPNSNNNNENIAESLMAKLSAAQPDEYNKIIQKALDDNLKIDENDDKNQNVFHYLFKATKIDDQLIDTSAKKAPQLLNDNTPLKILVARDELSAKRLSALIGHGINLALPIDSEGQTLLHKLFRERNKGGWSKEGEELVLIALNHDPALLNAKDTKKTSVLDILIGYENIFNQYTFTKTPPQKALELISDEVIKRVNDNKELVAVLGAGNAPKGKEPSFDEFKKLLAPTSDKETALKLAKDNFASTMQELITTATGKIGLVSALNPNRAARFSKTADLFKQGIKGKGNIQSIIDDIKILGKDVNAQDEDGNSLLHLFFINIENTDSNQQQMLLNIITENGANLKLTNKNGKTPLEAAPEKWKKAWEAPLAYLEPKLVRAKVDLVLDYIDTHKHDANLKIIAKKAITDLKAAGGSNGYWESMISEVENFYKDHKDSLDENKLRKLGNSTDDNLYGLIKKYRERMEIKVY